MIHVYNNPYSNQDFLGFILQLFPRLWGFLSGSLGVDDIVSDELQILVLAGIAISAALVGAFLMLRRMSMLANSLSHTVLLGIVVAYLITHYASGGGSETHYEAPIGTEAMLLAALVMGIVTTFLTEFLSSKMRLQSDAANGLVFTSLFAIGIVLITMFTRNIHIGTEVLMGNVNLLHISDLQLVLWVLVVNLVSFSLFFKEFKITTFDPELARSLGISSVFFNYLLMTQVSATAVGAFRAVGVLMVLAFIIGPPMAARLLTHNLRKMLWLAVGIGCTASVIGVALARHILTVHHIPLSTAGLVVCVITALYLLALMVAPETGILAQVLLRRRLKEDLDISEAG